jgi:hypothetical protein
MVSNSLEIEDQELLVIVREKGVVAYVHLPFLVKEMEFENSSAHKDGLVLKDVTKRRCHHHRHLQRHGKGRSRDLKLRRPNPKPPKRQPKPSSKKDAQP